jgi:CRP/FNR family cyclic AMP-dependent transcriptional regulator
MRTPTYGQCIDDTLSVQAGATIFVEGEPGDRMYRIISGEVDIRYRNRSLAVARAGELIGEMSLIDRDVRSATAVARTDCELAPIDSRRFLAMVQESPAFALEVMELLVKRLRQSNSLEVQVQWRCSEQ